MRTPTRALLAATAIGVALIGTGCGGDHGTSVADRTIDVTMTDNAFAPTELRVAAAETVTFRFRNDGSVVHEAIVGDEAVQDQHHADMRAGTTAAGAEDDGHGDDGHRDDGHAGEGDAITVAPGETGSITVTFDDTGTVLIGCHEPGHWESGMKASVIVG